MTVAAAFLVLLLGPIHAQHDPSLASCWENDFAPWDRPWSIPVWTALSTLEVGRYCCKPLGQALVPLACLGAAVLWRRGARGPTVLLAVPVLLALAAAFLHRYPYGGDRVMVFAAPALVLLVGAATPPTWDWLRRRHRLAPAALALLFLPPVYAAAKSVIYPWPTADIAGAAAYVNAHRRVDDVVVGNDWTDLYYFRGIGTAYRPNGVSDAAGRCWVVFSMGMPAPKDRATPASQMGPPGWVAVEQRDFLLTTVLLLERPETKVDSLQAE